MKNNSRRLVPLVLGAAIATLPATASAQGYGAYSDRMGGTPYFDPDYYPEAAQPDDLPPDASYGEQAGYKAASGFANLATSWLEVPKNMINATNEGNLALGLTGGTFKGLVNMVGRMLVGGADLITFWLPTKPIPNPDFVWQDFDADSTYGPVFRLRESAEPAPEPVAQAPEPAYAAPPPPPSTELDTAARRLENAARETDRKLDKIFDYQMKK